MDNLFANITNFAIPNQRQKYNIRLGIAIQINITSTHGTNSSLPIQVLRASGLHRSALVVEEGSRGAALVDHGWGGCHSHFCSANGPSQEREKRTAYLRRGRRKITNVKKEKEQQI